MWMKIVLHSEVLLGMEQLLIAFVQRVGWAQELLKENCGERKALWCARRRIPLPRGMTRRLRHGSRACSSMGRSHFSFDGERKVCKRKPAARRLQRRPAPLRVIRKYRRSGHGSVRLLYFAQACQSLTAYGSCAHWARAPSRPTLRSAVAERLDDPNKFGSSNSGLRAGTV